MSNIRILHISDVHWSPKNERDVSIVREALLNDLRHLTSVGGDISFVVFSGDLVNSGTDPKHFERAFDQILSPIIKTLKLTKDRLFICPGNHDIDRDAVTDYIETGLKDLLKSTERSNDFIDRVLAGDGSRKSAFERLKNFNVFNRPSKPPNIYSNLMMQAYQFEIGGEKIGIACFNTSWRCTGAANDADLKFLVIGERNIDEAVRVLGQADIKIAVFHHPTEWLADFDQSAILGRLYSEFDLLMHGHVHKSLPELRFNSNGTAIISQAGCLYNSRTYPNSYQVVELDAGNASAKFTVRTYIDSRRVFDSALNVAAEGVFSCDFFGRKKLDADENVRRVLRSVGLLIRQKEADHLDIGRVFSSSRADARTTFVCPPLSKRKHDTATADEEGADRETFDELVDLEDLLRSKDNLVFLSEREGGKTSLGNHISVLTTEGMSDKDRVPVVIDFSLVTDKLRTLEDAAATYFKNLQRRPDIGSLVKSGNVLFIVDNSAVHDSEFENKLRSVVAAFPGNRWIFLADNRSIVGDPLRKTLKNIALFVHLKALPRRAIREMSRKWCQLSGVDDREANEFIVRQIKENQLPRTGYIVALLMWAYQQQKKLERINESYLLSAVVNSLLDKADFRQALRREFDPVSAEITLQHLAVLLRDSHDLLKSNEVLAFLIEFFSSKALDFNAREVLNKMIACGILSEANDHISFKYKCFQEFFFAAHLEKNEQLRIKILSEDVVEYGRELYLLSGLRRQNQELLASIKSRLEKSVPAKLAAVAEDFTEILDRRVYDEESKKKITTLKTKRITSDEVDDFLDASEREMDEDDLPAAKSGEEEPVSAVNYRSRPGSISHYMDEVSLFGAILKNSEFDDGYFKQEAMTFYFDKIFRFISYMTVLFERIVAQWFKIKKEIVGGNDRVLSAEEAKTLEGKIVFVLHRLLMTILSLKVSDDLATEKLAVTYRTLLNREDTNPLIILFVSLLMYDVNSKGWDAQLEKVTDENKCRPFVLDIMTDRIWHDLYTRVEPEDRRIAISKVVDGIAGALGEGGPNRQSSRQAVDRAATLTRTRDG